MQHIHQLISRISEWRKELKEILLSDQMTFAQCDHVLNVMHNGLKHRVGEVIIEPATNAWQPAPLTYVLGEAINEIKPLSADTAKPSSADINKLKQEVQEAYGGFVERNSESILANMEDMIIRGVAKKAGMDVTSIDPEIITIEFIDSIKEAIKNKYAVEVAKESVNSANEDTIIKNNLEEQLNKKSSKDNQLTNKQSDSTPKKASGRK